MRKLKLSFLIALVGLFSTVSSKAEEVFEFEGGRFVYSTIVQLKLMAGEYLKNLDAKILAKEKAAESPWNPFAFLAERSADRLRGRRDYFLKLKWDCPHFYECDECGGDGIDTIFDCLKCSKTGFLRCKGNVKHPLSDEKEVCQVTLGALLGVNASY